MKRFEYKYLELHMSLTRGSQLFDLAEEQTYSIGDFSDYGPGLVTHFNMLGAQGWELVGFAVGEKNVFEFAFKRELSFS